MTQPDRVPMASPSLQYHHLKQEIDAAVLAALERGSYILGPECRSLEEEVAVLCGAARGIGVNSGTDALFLSLMAVGLRPGDEVITTPFTFFATAEIVSNLGAKPVFVDIDPRTFNLDPDRVDAAITPRTRAVLPVHLFGQMADMTALRAIAKSRDLPIIEDAAQALGAAFDGSPAGSLGDATAISFFPTKNLGACGDGGMAVTSRDDIAESLRLLRFHGSGGALTYERFGINSRLDELQAAILRVKLKKLAEWNSMRQSHAARYDHALESTRFEVPYRDPRCVHIFHQYTIRAPQRDDLQGFLSSRGIDSKVYYDIPLHRQPVYRNAETDPDRLRRCDEASKVVLSLPVFAEMTLAQQDRVIEALLEFDRTH